MTSYLRSGSPPPETRAVPAGALETTLEVPAAQLASSRTRDFVSLTKPRVVLMIVVTTAVAYHLGSATRPDWIQFWHTLAGTALAAGGTLAGGGRLAVAESAAKEKDVAQAQQNIHAAANQAISELAGREEDVIRFCMSSYPSAPEPAPPAGTIVGIDVAGRHRQALN